MLSVAPLAVLGPALASSSAAPAREPERLAHVHGEEATAHADPIATPPTRPEAAPC
ncbi:hypothetical protein [Streptomyces sp. NPDC058985]|uniref:hypothetical protein n=1 Tax=Streptomyces sp. NPDC058985 TaxID=3346684 RepID=UPI0036C77953